MRFSSSTHFCRESKSVAIYALYPESVCLKNFAIRKVFVFSDSGTLNQNSRANDDNEADFVLWWNLWMMGSPRASWKGWISQDSWRALWSRWHFPWPSEWSLWQVSFGGQNKHLMILIQDTVIIIMYTLGCTKMSKSCQNHFASRYILVLYICNPFLQKKWFLGHFPGLATCF